MHLIDNVISVNELPYEMRAGQRKNNEMSQNK